MDPFDQLRRPRIKPEAIIAFVIGTMAAYFIQFSVLGLIRPNGLLTFLIIAVIGGGWYHIRKVV
jgi:hypothetical protein